MTVQRTIPALGVLRSNVTSLFGVPSVDGWLQAEASGNIGGVLAYTDTVNGGSTSVQMLASNAADSSLIFGHIADLAPWWTGIALANSSTTAAQVEVYALDSSGNLIGGPVESPSAAFTLAAQSKTAFLLGNVIPQTQARGTDGGYVYVRTTNGVTLYGTELFFLRSGRVYANVPATRVAAIGVGFTPPVDQSGGVDTCAISVEDAYIGDANRNRITSFRPGTTITLNLVVNNASGRAANITREYRAGGPGGYPLYFFSTVGEQAAGRTTRFSTMTVPADAPAGEYNFSGSTDCNGVLSSASGTSVGEAASGTETGTGGTTGTAGSSSRVTVLGPVTLQCRLREIIGATCSVTLSVRITGAVQSSTPAVIMGLSATSVLGGALQPTATPGIYTKAWTDTAIASVNCRNATFEDATTVYDGILDQNPPLIGTARTTIVQTCQPSQ